MARVRIAIERNRNQGVDRLTSFVCVILAHTDEAPPALVYRCVCIEPFAFWGNWSWYVGRVRRRTGAIRRRPADHVNPLVRKVGVIDHAIRHDVRAATVLVDAAAYVVVGRRQIGDGTIGGAPDKHVAPAFLRTPLDPVDVVAVKGDITQAESLFGNGRGGNARGPRPVRSGDRHLHNLSFLRGRFARTLARALSLG